MFPKLLYLSVTTRDVIGQFCKPHFTVRPAKFEAVPFPRTRLTSDQRYGKYLTNLGFSVRTVSYGSSFFAVDLRPEGPQTRLVTGIYILCGNIIAQTTNTNLS